MILSPSQNPSRFRNMILLLVMAGMVVLLLSPVSAKTGVSISAQGDQSYYLGEEVILSGYNYDSDFTYLFITGPGIAPDGGKLTEPLRNVTLRDTGSFDRVQTNPDKSWEYTLYTYNLGLNPGPYSLYAAGRPETAARLNGTRNQSVNVIFKKPFITAVISPSPVVKGQPFSVNGSAEGNPREVLLWIIGDNFVFATPGPTDADSLFSITITAEQAKKIPKGEYSLIVQHPMQNLYFDLFPIGEWVQINVSGSERAAGMNLFKITGPGSLQGRNAAGALIAAFNSRGVDDTYTEIPVTVHEEGVIIGGAGTAPAAASTLPAQVAPTTPVQHKTPASPLMYAPVGALILVMGICVLSRR